MSKGNRVRAEHAAKAAGGVVLSSPSYLQKLNWASKRIEDLGIVQDTWLGTGAYTFVHDRDAKTGQTIIRAKITEPPPSDFALIAGDAVHALRVSLDHLALELAVANYSPSPVPPTVEKLSEFPIFPLELGDDLGVDLFHRVKKKTGEPAPGSGLLKLQGVHSDAIEAIERIQPYHRGAAFAEDPLWLIHELDRIDKHRRLHFTAYALGGMGIGAGPSGEAYLGDVHFERAGHSGPVENGTPVAIFTASPDSHFQLNFSREITLSEPTLPEGRGLPEMLTALRDHVRDEVIPPLKPYL